MIKAKIIETGEIVDVRPVHHEIYDFMVCRNGGMMGEMYMRRELSIIGDDEKKKDKEHTDFLSLVAKMREAQKYRDMCSPEDYDNCSDADVYEFHVDEYLKKMKI